MKDNKARNGEPADAFGLIFGNLNAAEKPTGGKVPERMKKDGSLRLEFVPSRRIGKKSESLPSAKSALDTGRRLFAGSAKHSASNSSEALKKQTVLGRTMAVRKAHTVNGRDASERLDPPSTWEASQNLKKKAALGVVGKGMAEGGKRLERPDGQDVAKDDLGRTIAPTREQPLHAGNETRRADGSPIVRDADGNAKVFQAQNPDNDLTAHLKDEADDEKLQKLERKALAEAETRRVQPENDREAVSRYGERYRREAPAGVAKDVQNRMKEDPLPAKTSSETNEKVHRTETAAGSEGNDREGAFEDGRPRDEQTLHRAEDSGKSRRNSMDFQAGLSSRPGVSDARNRPAAGGTPGQELHTVKTSKSAVSEAPASTESETPALRMEAGAVSEALRSGAKPEAASRLAGILAARIEAIMDQARPALRLQLNPKNLGEIHIRMVTVGEGTRLSLRADKGETARILDQTAQQLALQLAKAGVQVESIDVDLFGAETGLNGQASDGFSEGREDSAGHGGTFGGNEPEGRTESPRRSLHDGEVDVHA